MRRGSMVRRRGGRLAVCGMLAAVTVGCGIVELGTDDPDADGFEEPLDMPDDDPVNPADEDVDNAEGSD
jgi:hypothetical protein